MQAAAAYSCHMEGDFATWLQAQLTSRGWRPADLARETKLAESTVSRILSGTRGAGRDAVLAIASALKLPGTVVLYQAGFLERDPEDPTQELDPLALEILQLAAGRPDAEQAAILATVKALVENFDRGSGKREPTGGAGKPAKG